MSCISTCSLSTPQAYASSLQLPASPSWTRCHCNSSDCHLEQEEVMVHLCYEVTIVDLKKFYTYLSFPILIFRNILKNITDFTSNSFNYGWFYFIVIKNEIPFWQQVINGQQSKYLNDKKKFRWHFSWFPPHT